MQSLLRRLPTTQTLTCRQIPRNNPHLSITARRHFVFSAPKCESALKPLQVWFVTEVKRHLSGGKSTTPPEKPVDRLPDVHDAAVSSSVRVGAVLEGSPPPPQRLEALNFERGRLLAALSEELSKEAAHNTDPMTIAFAIFKCICATAIVVGSLVYINWEWILAQDNLFLSLFWPFGPFPPAVVIGGYTMVVERSNKGKIGNFMKIFAGFLRVVRVFLIYTVASGTLAAFFLEVMRLA